MSRYEYSEEQNQVFLNNIQYYRNLIKGENAKQTENITRNFAVILINENSLLWDRKIDGNGVPERLVYFDNLLAGVVFPHEYYGIEVMKYFGRIPRQDKCKDPNKWVTHHEKRRKGNPVRDHEETVYKLTLD
ncbi:hypothetical protein ACFSFW_23560 [Fredinandcohnia salidurans]|uniref:Uncharacterized protein n=1 Tax=Fredinandcohnia salidurans TaxID=2595041 RepID=A0ABW4MVQ3_9BACI